MKASLRTTIVAAMLLVSSLVGAVVTLQAVDTLRTGSSVQDVLYISSSQLIRRLSLGYTGLMADIYWTRAVQYFGGKHHTGAEQYSLLAPLLEITTDLDPHLVVAYEFGANFLSPPPPNGAGLPERCVSLMEKGIRANPREWRLYYNLGFIYYLELHNYAKAAQAFERGSEVPNAYPYLKIMAANMAQHAGEVGMARMLWVTTFESTQEGAIRANAVAHLRALQVDEDVTNLEKVVAHSRKVTGHFPASLTELVQAGILPRIPVDPTGQPYKLMSGGRVEVRNPDNLPFITKGRPPGYKPPPPTFRNLKVELSK